jgi:hypothetical protein
VHVEEAPVGAKGHWMVKVKRGEKIVEVWFETDDAPPLAYCNSIKINKTHTSSYGNTVIEDYERTTPTPAPTPAPTPTATATPKWKSFLWTPAPTPTPTATPKWKSFLWTPAPMATQSPRSPGDKTEPEKPKDEVVKPPPPLEPPFELPNWLKPWWEATKYAVDGSEFAGALPGGKDSLGAIIARLNVEIRNAMINGNEEKREFYEKLKKKLTDIYNSMESEK